MRKKPANCSLEPEKSLGNLSGKAGIMVAGEFIQRRVGTDLLANYFLCN